MQQEGEKRIAPIRKGGGKAGETKNIYLNEFLSALEDLRGGAEQAGQDAEGEGFVGKKEQKKKKKKKEKREGQAVKK